MVKFNESDGVWRTIGGRRVFIRDGQSLSDAMKESGKFKSAKKKEGVRTLDGSLEKDNKGRVVSQDEYDKFREAYKNGEISKEDYRNDNYDALKEKTTKSGERDKRTTKQDAYTNNEDERPIPAYGYNDGSRIDPRTGERFFGKTKKEEKFESIKSQQSDIEKASGLKVKEAFETDLYGNGKEDRFMLDDDRWVSHTKEALGSKKDTWSINELKNGSIESKDFKSYDDMIKHLGGSNKTETITRNGKEYEDLLRDKYFGKNVDNKISEIEDNLWEQKMKNWNKNVDKINSQEVVSRINVLTAKYDKFGESSRDVSTGIYLPIKKFENGSGSFYKVEDYLNELQKNGDILKNEKEAILKNMKGNKESLGNNAYKKAFQEYKKKHPNTKLNLQKFVNMSEGK